jgi:hypothetical protein
MKLSPATIFILLLIFLVLSVLFCRWAMREVDGFIGYKFDTPPLETVILPMYSDKNNLHKMYDSLYFDNKNGNIVEIDATAYADASGNVSGTIDSSGSTITALHVLPRIGNSVKSYIIEKITDVIPTPATTTDKSYQSKVYPTMSKVTDSYTAFMMPWHDNTYVHIMNNIVSKPENIGTYAFTNGSSAQQYDYTDNAAMVGVDKSRPDTNAKNNTLVIDPIYNTKRKVYQISEFVKYDISNSNILVSVGDKELKVYSRNASNAQTLTSVASNQETTNGDEETNVASINFAPRVIYDLCGQNMIVYVPSAKKTLVALVCYNADVKLDLRNVCRFNENGLDMGDTPSTNSGSDDKKEDAKDDKKEDAKDDKKEDKKDDKKMTDYGDFDMDDYMLKTQIIPPVCPTCPSCNYNNGGACNQCGGGGGCGTRTSNGDSLVTGGNPIRGAIDASGNVAGGAVDASGNVVGGVVDAVGAAAGGVVNAAGNVAGGAVNAAGNVLNTTVDTAGNVVNKTIDTAGNVVNKTVGAATDVATGALGAVGNVASSALGVFGNVLGGAGNMLPSGSGSQGGSAGGMRSQQYQPMSAGMSQQYPVSGSTSTTDPYSYQGALPIKKPTEFMPITADFSSFGR